MRDDFKEESYEEKGSYRKGFFGGVFAAVFIVLAALLVYTVLNLHVESRGKAGTAAVSVGSSEADRKLERLKALIDKYYLEDAEDSKLVEGMYAGMVSGLGDPYTVYYTKEEYSALMESATGRYAGIGAQMSQNIETGLITITNPFEGSPAQKAGILPGDILLAVDGEETGDQDLTNIVTKIKGEAGTDVTLTLFRNNTTLDITVTRDNVEVQTVTGRMLGDSVGYIYVMEFDEVTTEQFKDTLNKLLSEGMESLIIDLRDNPGGSLEVVCDMLDYILPEGLLVYTEDKYGNREEVSSDAEHKLELPMAVLVNGNSASASEIFAGAVKDYKWGTIVGTTTYGKGIVQRVFDLGDGTAMKITISKYYTPSGKNIHGVGITPDVEVELPKDVYEDGVITEEEDTQVQKAIEILNGR